MKRTKDKACLNCSCNTQEGPLSKSVQILSQDTKTWNNVTKKHLLQRPLSLQIKSILSHHQLCGFCKSNLIFLENSNALSDWAIIIDFPICSIILLRQKLQIVTFFIKIISTAKNMNLKIQTKDIISSINEQSEKSSKLYLD